MVKSNNKKYVIIPGCSDLNRGDQALVWETKRLAEQAGFVGDFYLTTERNEPIKQSEKHGIKPIIPVLEHPSRKYKNKDNINYSVGLKFKWGLVAILDTICSLLLLNRVTRPLMSSFLSKEKKKALEIFEECDAVFMKGGGLLQTYGGLTSTYSMFFWTFPIFLAHALNKNVYVMPNSFGPFEGPFVKKIAKRALDKCKVVTSRESISQEMLKNELNVESELLADLAFNLPATKTDNEKIIKKYDLPKNKKLVGFTMRPYRFPNSINPEEAYTSFKEEMASFIHWVYTEGYMPVIVEHTLAKNAHENDGQCIREVVEMLDKKEYRLVSNQSLDCQDLKKIYSMFDYIVGTRFHSAIFSFSEGVPGIAISYTGNKSVGIMHDMKLDNFVIKIEDVNANKLKTKFKNLVDNEDDVREKLHAYVDKAKADFVLLGKKMSSSNMEER